ncbi:sulfotransferase domain-containing protein, partial [Alphaproteobacteria bacterium]|nr:sulfotransferase domain-containing protein [Alphaproteobacteria bacterium]
MSKHIFWIASYPKSGNTLVRAIISSLFFSEDGVFNFKMLGNINQFDTISNILRNKKIFGSDLNKIDNLKIFSKYWIKLQEKKHLNFSEDFIFLKTHSSNVFVDKNPFTVENNCRGIIYIVRDPRDICVSFSKHFNISLEESIKFLKDPYSSIVWKEKKTQMNIMSLKPSSLISSWDTHVLSWTEKKWKTPVLVLKFEDLVYDKKNQIKKLILFFEKFFEFKFKNKNKKINNILYSTDFNKLKN